jgi:hypothetical protein
MYRIEQSLKKFNFFPIQKQTFIDVQKWFANSKIIKPEMVTVEFLTEILPNTKPIRCELLY